MLWMQIKGKSETKEGVVGQRVSPCKFRKKLRKFGWKHFTRLWERENVYAIHAGHVMMATCLL